MPSDTRIDLAAALTQVHHQVVVALWLSGGMVLATLMVAAVAIGWRRAGLALGAAYAASLCFVPVGHAHVLGPVGLAFAAGGWMGHGRVR
jgi:hypothetical protein